MAKKYSSTDLILALMEQLGELEALYIHNTRGEIIAAVFPRATLDELEVPDKFLDLLDHDHIEPGQF